VDDFMRAYNFTPSINAYTLNAGIRYSDLGADCNSDVVTVFLVVNGTISFRPSGPWLQRGGDGSR
jgi:hypothetical protein